MGHVADGDDFGWLFFFVENQVGKQRPSNRIACVRAHLGNPSIFPLCSG